MMLGKEMTLMLDSRLSLALEMYDTVETGADIGTDHAHLPIALLRSGKCGRMILTDLSPDALQNARENIGRARLTDRVDFRLGDGLRPLDEPCGMVSVLGMGGRTIRDILLSAPERLRGASLLLSAHTDLPLVRESVTRIGYRISAEHPCYDAGRYYLLIRAVPGEEALTPREIRLGKALFDSSSPVLGGYLRRRRRVLEARLEGLRRAGDLHADEIAEVEEDIRILEAEEKRVRE